MDRCHLKGEYGDRLHALLCAAGYNIKWHAAHDHQEGLALREDVFFVPEERHDAMLDLAGIGRESGLASA